MSCDEVIEISGIQFGVLSKEEILKNSVCEITNSKLSIEPDTVYDELMGPSCANSYCGSCGRNNQYCPGHYGHVLLVYPVFHPLYHRYILLFLKCFCIQCYRLLFHSNKLHLLGFEADPAKIVCSKGRFLSIFKHLEKMDYCQHCNSVQPRYNIGAVDGQVVVVVNYKRQSCKNKQNQEKQGLNMFANDVLTIFEQYQKSDLNLLGIDTSLLHPKSLIIEALPVVAPRARPQVVSESIICDDDITIQYTDIVKKNNKLRDPTFIDVVKRKKEIDKIYFRIKSLFDNSQGRAKHSNGGRVIKGIRERISGKDGLIRCNLLGKRVNQSARTVISADVTLRLGEMIVPQEIAQELTTPVYVNQYNIDYLKTLLKQGKINFYTKKNTRKKINLKYALKDKGTALKIGDVVVRVNGNTRVLVTKRNIETVTLGLNDKIWRDNVLLKDIRYPAVERFNLNVGDLVEHQLLNNKSYVLLNRQPTLHNGSLIAHKVLIRPYKTFRLPLAITSSYNADFDGDEMNIHVCGTVGANAEMENIMDIRGNFINAQGSFSNIKIVQDGLLAMYLLTLPDVVISYDLFCSMVVHFDDQSKIMADERFLKWNALYRKEKKYAGVTGKDFFSLLLPPNFWYTKKNRHNHPTEPTVVIQNGFLLKGVITKSILDGSQSSLIQALYINHGVDIALEFCNNIQFIANEYLLHHGFTIGVQDCFDYNQEAVNEAVTRTLLEAYDSEQNHSKSTGQGKHHKQYIGKSQRHRYENCR